MSQQQQKSLPKIERFVVFGYQNLQTSFSMLSKLHKYTGSTSVPKCFQHICAMETVCRSAPAVFGWICYFSTNLSYEIDVAFSTLELSDSITP